MHLRSRGASASGSCDDVQPMRGRREGRVSADTHGPRATRKHAAEPQAQPNNRPSLRGWFYGLYALSSGTGVLAPVPHDARQKHRELDVSTGTSGPHDFAVRIDNRSSDGINASTASRAQRP
jgi:hypothetical protein